MAFVVKCMFIVALITQGRALPEGKDKMICFYMYISLFILTKHLCKMIVFDVLFSLKINNGSLCAYSLFP